MDINEIKREEKVTMYKSSFEIHLKNEYRLGYMNGRLELLEELKQEKEAGE